MKWLDEEKLRRALPYGAWRWEDADGQVETIFNRHYQPIASKINGTLALTPRLPPRRMLASEYFFQDVDLPWKDNEARLRCEAILKEFKIDPTLYLLKIASKLMEERTTAKRARWNPDRWAARRG